MQIDSKLLAKEADLAACEGEIHANQSAQRNLTHKNDLLQKRARILRMEIIALREILSEQVS